jgi:predicted dehydrogenase
MAVRLGVVGYGAGGRFFHTPFIRAAEGIELAGVVTRSPAFAAAVRGEGRLPVPALEAVRTLAALDAARLSSEQGRSIQVECQSPRKALP